MIYINLWTVIVILFLHWIFDFVLQTDKQSKDKSTVIEALLAHTIIYSFCWFIVITLLIGITQKPYTLLYFIPITFIAHTITDYFTSKLNAKLWKEKKVHNFFVSIGFDQWLHCAQLLITYQLLNNN